MARLVELADLLPFVFGQVVYFTLLCGVVGVLGTDCEKVVLGLVLHALVEVGKLMARASILHVGPALHLIGCFVNHKAIRSNDRSDVVFLLLASDAEDFVVNLD